MAISSTFFASIQKQKTGLTPAVRAGGPTLTAFITSYISFLQANNQYTSTLNLVKYANLNPIGPANGSNVYSNQSQIDQAMIDVIKSIYGLEGQEVTRITQDGQNSQYESASTLYQSAYNLSMIAQGLDEASFKATETTEGSTDFCTMQSAIEGAKVTYTFIKTCVTDYDIVSQIDALYLQLSNFGDVNQKGTFKLSGAQTALKNFLVGLNTALNTLQSSSDSNTTNDTCCGHASSNFAITIGILLLVCVCGGAYFFFGKHNQNISMIPARK